MAFSKDVIDRVIEESDIVDVISEYISLKKSGKNFKGLCPFHHEKTPSFSVSQDKQLYHCFGCHASGNVITFVMNIENVSFVEAVEMLAERAGILIDESKLTKEEYRKKKLKDEIYIINKLAAVYFYRRLYSKEGHAALKYLNDRGIDDKTIKKFGLGYSYSSGDNLFRYFKEQKYSEDMLLAAGLVLKNSNGYYDRFKNRIMFPIIDEKNNVIGFGGRVLDKSLPKYLNSPETPIFKKSKTLYGINFAKKSDNDKFIIVEGYMDAIALHQSGIDFAVASLGTALTSEQGKLIKKYRENVIIAYDADEAGLSATLRGLDILDELNLNVRILSIPNGKDPDEFVRKEGFDSFHKLLKNTESLIEYKARSYKRNLNMEKPEDKIKYIRKVAVDLAKVTDNVKREVYISAASKEAQIPENAVRAEIERFVNSNGIKNNKNRYTVAKIRHNNIYGDNSKISPEKYLLALLLYDNDIYKRIEKRIDLNFIENTKLKPIFETIIERLDDGRDTKINDISYLMQDEALIAEFNDIIKVLYENNEMSDKVADDCISKIMIDYLIKKRDNIKEEINKAYVAGDIEAERRLLVELQNCEKEMLRTRNG